ncbi:hypothetical protein [Streptomyces sp. NPDC056452]|uniref:hypothetical protein n=1 Tax=Streptomyces sp. NPDC056452 TaxID=3345821 RepID=UPI003674B3B0
MSSIDWGTAPTWISSLVTTIALGVTAGVVWNDRRKHQSADARLLTVTTADPDVAEGDGHALIVANLAERPILEVSVHFLAEFPPGRLAGIAQPASHSMTPGFRQTLTYEATYMVAQGDGMTRIKWAPHAVSFTDADGVRWLRSLHDRKLTRMPRRGNPRKACINGRTYRLR